ncbi:MAG TPA: hypothetical protein VNN72_08290 [Polyangiaceae bacterium]|nr:hypothetical protein [Polyangiaceae bacterium]
MLRTLRPRSLPLFVLLGTVPALACSSKSDGHDRAVASGGRTASAGTGGAGAGAAAGGASARGGASSSAGASGRAGAGAGAGTGGGGTPGGGNGGSGNAGAGGTQVAGSGGAASGMGGNDAPGGSAGASVEEEGLGVRFIGFISEDAGADLPASTEFLTRFPECTAEESTQYPPSPRFNECFARGIVQVMNEALAELIPNAPHFRFQSLEIIADDRLATFHSEPNYSGYELDHLLGGKYRVGNTMTFLMPSLAYGSVGGLTWIQGERLNPDAGMAAIAVPGGGTTVFLHEFGHGVGFPHASNAANAEPYVDSDCGVTIEPPECSCETENFMETSGSFADVSGCEPCTFSTPVTFNTAYFGPKFAEIAACWATHRFDDSGVGFLDGDCYGIVDASVSTCKEIEGGGVTCLCPSGEVFVVDDCLDSSQDARNAATSDACPRITCTPPPERSGVVCQGLAGTPNIECTCEDPAQKFYLGSDCSSLTLADIERICPPI